MGKKQKPERLNPNPSPLAGDLVLRLTRLSLELIGEQGAQDFTGDPRHEREQQEQDKHEYQHESGGDQKLDHR